MATQTGSYDFKTAKQAKLSAEATASADATNKANDAKKYATNFLASDSSGIMIYDGENGTQTPTSPSADTKNVFIDSDSVDIRQGTTVLATFGSDETRIGLSNKSHINIDSYSLQMVDKDNNVYFKVTDLRGQDGLYEATDSFVGDGSTKDFVLTFRAADTNYTVKVNNVVETNVQKTVTKFTFTNAPSKDANVSAVYTTTSADAKAFTFGSRGSGVVGGLSTSEGYQNVANGQYSHAEGRYATASGESSHAEGWNTKAIGANSHAEGLYTTASYGSHAEGGSTTASGQNSHAEGSSTTASGTSSHAEGLYTTASGTSSHAEGSSTTASGGDSHAEGAHTIASGIESHAEGHSTTASGNYSHAQNCGTIASRTYQTAMGKYNVEDSNSIYALIIGNGTKDSARSNAYAVTWEGDEHLELDVIASSGDDYNLYTAIIALGWQNDVLV